MRQDYTHRWSHTFFFSPAEQVEWSRQWRAADVLSAWTVSKQTKLNDGKGMDDAE